MRARKNKGEGKAFYNSEEVIIAYNEGKIDLHAPIKVKATIRKEDGTLESKLIETTVGRVIFNQHRTSRSRFCKCIADTKKSLREIIGDILRSPTFRKQRSSWMILKNLVSSTAFQGGLSFSINDLIIPEMKQN